MPPRKRKAEEAAEYRVPSPQDDDMLDEYKCAITHELPIDPVVAEDGHTYERSAIEQWLENHTPAKSPMTNEPMGKKLVPAVQTRNAIERLVQKGIIQGEAADTWSQRQAEMRTLDKEWREVLYKAYGDDTESMRRVGYAYRDGSHGFKTDRARAIHWWQRASKRGCVMSTACLGISHALGKGFPLDTARGLIELTRAATLGSEHGAICVGNHLALGRGLKAIDEDAARWWYNYSKTCNVKDTTDDMKRQRENWLKTHGE